MRLVNDSTGEEYQVHVPEDVEVVIDGKSSKLDELREGMAVKLTTRHKSVIRVEAFTRPAKEKGR